MKTDSGVKDTFQGYFIDKIFSTRRGTSVQQRELDIEHLKATFPSNTTSPVWRIKGLSGNGHDATKADNTSKVSIRIVIHLSKFCMLCC